jgi:hypothetical protein
VVPKSEDLANRYSEKAKRKKKKKQKKKKKLGGNPENRGKGIAEARQKRAPLFEKRNSEKSALWNRAKHARFHSERGKF